MSYETLLWQLSDGILTLTLNRPDKLNAFTLQMAQELITAFRRASDDDAVRVVVVTGAGKAFCAGMDLSATGNVFGLNESLLPTLEDLHRRLDDPEIEVGVRDTGGRLTLAIHDCNKPVIAAINGAAVGIGATMTCAMDIRLASDQARIGFVFNRIGITPEACSTWFLPRLVGLPRALEWCFSADILDARTALAGGFLSRVVPADQLMQEAYVLANRLARHSPVAMALTRHMLYRNSAMAQPLDAHLIESLAIFYCSRIGAPEGIKAFLEKRQAEFIDRVSEDMPLFYPWWEERTTRAE